MVCLGCEGGGGGGDGGAAIGAGSGGAAAGRGIDDFVAVLCERARHCCAAEGLSTAPLDDCETASPEESDFFAAFHRGTATLVEPAYSECVRLLEASVHVCDLGREAPAACSAFFRGTVPVGGPCLEAVECEHDGAPVLCLKAANADDGAPGECRAMTRGRLGDACTFSVDERSYGLTYSTAEVDPNIVFCDAEDGLYCPFAGEACTALANQGAPCSGGDSCRAGLYCDGTCKPEKPAGAACVSSQECALPAFCKAGLCTQITYADTNICQGDTP